MKFSEIIQGLHDFAPQSSQESYDNAGIIYGHPDRKIKKALISLDCTEEVVIEAKKKKCDLIISHHPLLFKAIKNLSGENYIERTLIKAIQLDIAVFALHTNLDNSMMGVNRKIGELLGFENPAILSPKKDGLLKISVYCPVEALEDVSSSMFAAGAGNIGHYRHCSFSSSGTGTFSGNNLSKPVVGKKNRLEKVPEVKLEVVADCYHLKDVLAAMRNSHPYEEIAYDCYELVNPNPMVGSGMIADLPKALAFKDFIKKLKSSFKCEMVRFAGPEKRKIKRVAWCGGSGSFLIDHALAAKADIFITGDIKYHDFFKAEDKIIIADIGHYESEQYTIQLIGELLQKKFPTFAACFTETSTNPVQYY